MSKKSFLRIGRIVKPHGVKGEMCVQFDADSPYLLDELEKLFLELPNTRVGRPKPYVVRSWRPHKGRVLLTLEGVSDRNDVDALRGVELFIRERDLPPVDEDEFYLHDIEGAEAVLPDGAPLGVVKDFLIPTDEQEIWIIETPDGKEVMLPAHDDTVLEVDVEAARVVVAPPPGLLELYLDDATLKNENPQD